ncbi:MAG: flavodoxin family protein [Proteobacteria bacterium]|nr:flavodoxin family protein [Pseudomonadota bacterium]
MKALFINGSPRKNFNTVEALESAMKGAQAAGDETERINLYDLQYKGCMSCFACKLKNSKTEGVCAIKDALRPVLEKCKEADILVLGSPIYYSSVTGMMRSFMERLMFPAGSYVLDENGKPNNYFKNGKKTAMIYTMNVPEEALDAYNYPQILKANADCMKMVFGHCEELYICNTYQFKDYSKYDINMFKEDDKARHRKDHFPIDLQNAFDLGKRLAEST